MVVTVPMHFWHEWIAEGDAVGEPASGEEWWFTLGRTGGPLIQPGDRVYIVAHGRLRGYAPLTRLARDPDGCLALCREGGAVACTIPRPVRGFQAWRYRFWERSEEVAFPGWKTP